MRSRALALLAALLLAGLAGCSIRVGSAPSPSSWRGQADQALGTAVSALATADLILVNRREGRLTRSYAVVGIRDALTSLETEASSFRAVQPPPSAVGEHHRVVAALSRSLEVLTTASVALAGPDPAARRAAEAPTRTAANEVRKLQDEIAGSGR